MIQQVKVQTKQSTCYHYKIDKKYIPYYVERIESEQDYILRFEDFADFSKPIETIAYFEEFQDAKAFILKIYNLDHEAIQQIAYC